MYYAAAKANAPGRGGGVAEKHKIAMFVASENLHRCRSVKNKLINSFSPVGIQSGFIELVIRVILNMVYQGKE